VDGPRTARLMAAHAERTPFTPIVRAYFAAHPRWLEKLLGDPSASEHHEALDVLVPRTKKAKK